MKFVLILMVRNESKILERCLKAVEDVVDEFCIHDTGSTDNTCEIAETFLQTHKGCLTRSEWKNFGYNRTQSFLAAQTHVNSDPNTYGLLLDADMVFHAGSLRSQPLTEIGYTLIQKNGVLSYPNTRLVRMDHPWSCRGVTHEYWDGPCLRLPECNCWIQDENDGGCKDDKLPRDARLLEAGLAEEPTNERYMFYLAQTYHGMGRKEDALAMYKKRFKAGGWGEEQWYSLYMMAQTYLSMENPEKFEATMLRAYKFRPGRAESVYKLAKYFREKGEHFKAYHYAKLGKSIPLSTDALFVEPRVYTGGLFDYEMTILLYYLDKKPEGLRESFKYLFAHTEHLESVYKNMSFYVEPIGTNIENHPIMRDICGRDFHPTSVSSCGPLQNVRFVNYSINHRGGYDMKEGSYSPDHAVRTRNVAFTSGGVFKIMDDSSIDLPRFPSNIRGLEDIRLYRNSQKILRFVATSKEYEENKLRIVEGAYNPETGSYKDCCVLPSPMDSSCEKNWIPIDLTDDILYSWRPLRVGSIVNKKLVFHVSHDTPWFFQHLRGSAIPIRVGEDLWCLVHFVDYTQPRKYFHCVVVLSAKSYTPKKISKPFAFRSIGIEYCLSMTVSPDSLLCIVSSWDDDPCSVTIPFSSLEWFQV